MNLTRLGTDYGGWTVDLDSIPENGCVLDIGVGLDTSFAEELYALKSATIIFVDPGEQSEKHVASLRLPGSMFIRAAVASRTGKVKLFKHRTGGSDSLCRTNRNVAGAFEEVDCVSLKSLYETYSPDLVKLDIEGAEYAVYPQCAGIKQIAIEFHHRLLGIDETNTDWVVKFYNTMGYSVINRTDHSEITFLRDY